MKFRHLLVLPFLACAAHAHADIYKRVDADGNVTYSNKPIKGGRKVELAPLPTVRSYDENGSDYERVKQTTQRSRDDARRKMLEEELATEEKLLADARKNLQDAQGNPHISNADGTADPNAARQEDDIKNAQEQVDLHERNVQAIKQELASIK